MAHRPPLGVTAALAAVVLAALSSTLLLEGRVSSSTPKPAAGPRAPQDSSAWPSIDITAAVLPMIPKVVEQSVSAPVTIPSVTAVVTPVTVSYGPGYTELAWPAVGMAPRNATEACISRTENGGSYGRSTNPSHFGRWQFDRPTWDSNGGDDSHWGYASPAEQDAVFITTVSRNGYGQWTNYDGC